jgi:hypothetical protein
MVFLNSINHEFIQIARGIITSQYKYLFTVPGYSSETSLVPFLAATA